MQVRTLSHEEADEIYEIRISLEALIGRKVVEGITSEGLLTLRGILEQMKDAANETDVNPYTNLNLEFHDTLARLTGNAKLHRTYSKLVAQLTLFRRRAYQHDKQSMALSLREHLAIFHAIEQGDAGKASELLSRHAEDSRRRLHEALLPMDTDKPRPPLVEP